MERPKIGIGVIIRNGNKVLLGKRKGSHGEGTWAFPGGHLELNESFENCAKREVEEETGLIVGGFKKGTFTNDIFVDEQKHYVTLYLVTDWVYGEPKIMEPEKCEKWEWFTWDKLPEPLFLALEDLLLEEFNPFNI